MKLLLWSAWLSLRLHLLLRGKTAVSSHTRFTNQNEAVTQLGVNDDLCKKVSIHTASRIHTRLAVARVSRVRV